MRHVEVLRLLGGVRVGRAGVDLELADLLAAEAGLREHAPDAAAHGLFGLAGLGLEAFAGVDTPASGFKYSSNVLGNPAIGFARPRETSSNTSGVDRVS